MTIALFIRGQKEHKKFRICLLANGVYIGFMSKIMGTALLFSLVVAIVASYHSAGAENKMNQYRKLTQAEAAVIVNKGTEPAFSGKYVKHKEDGTYVCKRCGLPLFHSDTKFESGSGWPSFDDEIDGTVLRRIDADGQRIEIVCARCGAHLGHVFLGEGFTQKNTRNCVNSLSLDFVDEKVQLERAIFASGCFWGTEYYLTRAEGVLSTTVGYTGGHVARPTYQQVSTSMTGHAESVEVLYDPSITTYEALARLFFETHDPTQVGRQGPDVGPQYRSAIFYLDDQQKEIAIELVAELEQRGYDVATQIVPAGTFWPAEDYHQEYYEKKNDTPYCHVYTKRF